MFVIQLNDSVRAVAIGDLPFATKQRDRMCAEYFQDFQGSFNNDWDEYLGRCCWHISEATVLEDKPGTDKEKDHGV